MFFKNGKYSLVSHTPHGKENISWLPHVFTRNKEEWSEITVAN
jgi:hypothetical protein